MAFSGREITRDGRFDVDSGFRHTNRRAFVRLRKAGRSGERLQFPFVFAEVELAGDGGGDEGGAVFAKAINGGT